MSTSVLPGQTELWSLWIVVMCGTYLVESLGPCGFIWAISDPHPSQEQIVMVVNTQCLSILLGQQLGQCSTTILPQAAVVVLLR